MPIYKALEIELGVHLIQYASILKIMHQKTDINDWHQASLQDDCRPHMNPKIQQNINPEICAALGFGEVTNTGWVDTALLVDEFTTYMKSKEKLKQVTFEANDLQIDDNCVRYRDIKAKHIVFTQGVGVLTHNPWFSQVPLHQTKGELMIIESKNLQEKSIIKGGVFMIPLGNHRCRVGSTYNRKDQKKEPTKKAQLTLQKQLDKMIQVPYHVVSQSAGFRPTIPDTIPVIAVLPQFSQLAICNGMSSRGLLQVPFCARSIYDYIQKGAPIPSEINLHMFK
ncbi:MAG: FAD-dependent oxidoreductase [Bacteroidota bacterium]|nr:FAD-dependent oxidoreductase [Bacteroidota bacterium]